MSRYIAEVKVTRVEYAGDHDREVVVGATALEATSADAALKGAADALQKMLATVEQEV